jgi:anthranilate/para-aminobenzoate synthase component I
MKNLKTRVITDDILRNTNAVEIFSKVAKSGPCFYHEDSMSSGNVVMAFGVCEQQTLGREIQLRDIYTKVAQYNSAFEKLEYAPFFVGPIEFEYFHIIEKTGIETDDNCGSMILFNNYIFSMLEKMVLVSLNGEEGLNEIEQIISQKETNILPALDIDELEFDHMGKDQFIDNVKYIKNEIRQGNLYQCVISERFTRKHSADPLQIFQTLALKEKVPYLYYYDDREKIIMGASPETLVKVEDQTASTYPIAGTRPIGETKEETKKHEKNLKRSPKEAAEHLMLVDLARNDLSRVCTDIHLTEFRRIKHYQAVMHLISEVKGTLQPNQSCVDAFEACFPAGTLSGAPKIQATKVISKLENLKRGPYGGAMVKLDFNLDLDSCIIIRSMIIEKDQISFQAGAGIVADSRPESEYMEVIHKTNTIRRIL